MSLWYFSVLLMTENRKLFGQVTMDDTVFGMVGLSVEYLWCVKPSSGCRETDELRKNVPGPQQVHSLRKELYKLVK